MASRLTTFIVVLIVAGTLIAGLIVGAQRDDESGPIDLIVTNGRVYRGSDTKFAEALAIRGNKILRVGSNREIKRLRRPQTTMVDAHGGSVLPGFNDAHVHFISGGLALSELNLLDTTTLDAIQSAVKEFAASHPERPWVRGRGWYYDPFPGGLPTRQQLDAVVPDRPAYLVGVRRPHRLGELEGARGRGHHAPHAEPARRRHREGRAHRRTHRRAQGGGARADGRRAAALHACGAAGRAPGGQFRRHNGWASRACRKPAARRTTSRCSTSCAPRATCSCGCTRRSRSVRVPATGACVRLDALRREVQRRSAAQGRRREADGRRRHRVSHGGDARAVRQQDDDRHAVLRPRRARSPGGRARQGAAGRCRSTRSATARSARRSMRSSGLPGSTPSHRAAGVIGSNTSRRRIRSTFRGSARSGVIASLQPFHGTPTPNQMTVWTANIGKLRASRGWRTPPSRRAAGGWRSAATGPS